MAASEYFSRGYAEARSRFVIAAKRAGANLATFVLPGLTGPNGEALAVDVAVLGSASASSALLVLSGTHGVEGFLGSGCQVGLLEDRFGATLPDSVCLMLVHALNPHGFAWVRRVNEDGVDLNRNWIDFDAPLPDSTAYEELHDWLVPADWRGPAWQAADVALQAYVVEHGMRRYQAAISVGQYTRPAGICYGGTKRAWSSRTLESILQVHVPRNVTHLAVLDLHTGLGPPGYGEPIAFSTSPGEGERAVEWYGHDVRDTVSGSSSSSAVVGALPLGIRAARPDLALTYVALEFGTRPLLRVLDALRADHWLHSGAERTDTQRAAVRAEMLDAYYMADPAWQAAAYGRVADFAYRAIGRLASLGTSG
jgi:hypothetical protein